MIWQRIRIEAAQGNWPGGISSIAGPLVHGAGSQAQHSAHKAFSVRFWLVDGVRSAERVCGLTSRRLQASGPGVFLKMIFGTKWTFGVPLWCAKVRNRHGRSVAIGGRRRVFLALRATGEAEEGYLPLLVDGNRVGPGERRPCIYALFKHVGDDDVDIMVVMAGNDARCKTNVCDAACMHACILACSVIYRLPSG